MANLLLLCDRTVAATEDPPKLPIGWKVERTVTVAANELDQFSRKFGGRATAITNTVYSANAQRVQVNVVSGASAGDAGKIHEWFLQAKKGNRDLVLRRGNDVIEFIAADLRLVRSAHYELGLKPKHRTYQVAFTAAPLDSGDSMAWNPLFNALLRGDAGAVAELAPKFEFSDQFRFRTHGQGARPSRWTFEPAARTETAVDPGDTRRAQFADLPRRLDVPQVAVTAIVHSDAFAVTPTSRRAAPELTAANDFWPSHSPEIRKLASDITAGKESRDEQVAALLEWLMPGRNIRFGGSVTGSRYGVAQVLSQRFGHCWDFSDTFITLARSIGIPCRQVAGWLFEGEGHVWAEVLIEGTGWRGVDPTAGMGCGSDYVPLFALEDGRMPVVYTSLVKIKVVGE